MIIEITDAAQIGAPIEVPEWVFIWSRARYKRIPRITETFPEQGWQEGEQSVMSAERREELQLDWLLAGAPRDLSALGSLALATGQTGEKGAA